MMLKKLSLLIVCIFILCCNIATAQTKQQIQDKIKQVEAARAANEQRQLQILADQGTQLRLAQAAIQRVDDKILPSLQKDLDKLTKIQSKYDKLKLFFISVASLFVGGCFLFLLLKFNVLLPYGWTIIPIAITITSTILYVKI